MNEASDPKLLTPEQIEVRQARKAATIFSQEAVNYTTLSETGGQACANCIFYRPTGYDGIDWPHCHLVQDWPKPIEPTGWCNRWEAVPEPDLSVDPLPVVIVEPEDDDKVDKGIVATLKDAVSGILHPDAPAFQVFKTKSGRKGWIARHTGKFIDREGEILSEKSHEEYVARVQSGAVKAPELWMWHAKGTKHGQAITVWKSGGFVLAAGLFDETAEGERAFAYYQKHAGKIKLSHGFHYPRIAKVNGVYHAYNTFEITTLPQGAEAFPYTSFEEIETMTLPEAARSMIAEALGEDALRRAEAADSKAAADTKTLESQGVAYKGYDQYDGSAFVEQVEKAVKQAVDDLDTRLKTVEAALAAMTEVGATLKTLNEAVKALGEQLTASQQAESGALERINALEAKLAEYRDVQPPASQSQDTLLSARELSFLDKVMAETKVADGQSLVEKLIGGEPAIAPNGGES